MYLLHPYKYGIVQFFSILGDLICHFMTQLLFLKVKITLFQRTKCVSGSRNFSHAKWLEGIKMNLNENWELVLYRLD